MKNSEAKALTLEVWRHFRDHPELYLKTQLPAAIYEQIKDLRGRCPLCELYFDAGDCVAYCPLGSCQDLDSPWQRWTHATSKAGRAEAAAEIVTAVENWAAGDKEYDDD